VPDDVLARYRAAGRRGADARAAWNARRATWLGANPGRADEYDACLTGRPLGGWEQKLPTFETAKTEFLKWSEANKKPRTHRGYRNFLTRLAGSFAGSRLSEIDPLSVERHKHARIKAGAPVAANRELMCLKALFNRCIAWDLYEGTNPMTTVSRSGWAPRSTSKKTAKRTSRTASTNSISTRLPATLPR